MNRSPHDVVVVGAGMLGASAARHLADSGCVVALVGEAEPADHRAHDGVFASHHDIGRVSRTIDPDPVRAWLGYRAVAQFADLAARTEIQAVHGVGHLWVEAADGLEALVAADRRFSLSCIRRSAADTMAAMPYLSLSEGLETLWEPPPAGWVDPRAYVRSEKAALEGAGATVLDTLVRSVVSVDGVVEVRTESETVVGDRVLLATGAFSGFGETPAAGLDVEYALHTQRYLQLDDDEAARLVGMPSIIAKSSDPDEDLYLTPPTTDPRGRTVLKVGKPQDDHMRASAADLAAWYRTDGDPAFAARLDRTISDLLPGLRWLDRWTTSCVTTYTPTGHPMIDALDDRVFCCIGGNGYAAKCAPALGELAAWALLGSPWPSEVDRDLFRASFLG